MGGTPAVSKACKDRQGQAHSLPLTFLEVLCLGGFQIMWALDNSEHSRHYPCPSPHASISALLLTESFLTSSCLKSVIFQNSTLRWLKVAQAHPAEPCLWVQMTPTCPYPIFCLHPATLPNEGPSQPWNSMSLTSSAWSNFRQPALPFPRLRVLSDMTQF